MHFVNGTRGLFPVIEEDATNDHETEILKFPFLIAEYTTLVLFSFQQAGNLFVDLLDFLAIFVQVFHGFHSYVG